MVTYGRKHCEAFSSNALNEDQKLGSTYYDGIRVFYQIADHTGDRYWNECALRARAVFRAYVIRRDGNVPGYWNFTTGLLMDWEHTGDVQSKTAVISMSQRASYTPDFTPLAWTASPSLSRDVSYAIVSFLNAERLGEPRRDRLIAFVDQALGHVDQWFISKSYRAPDSINRLVPGAGGQYYIQPFMVGLTTQSLIRYWEATRDPRVLPAVKTAVDWLWKYAWVPANQAFWYENWVSDPRQPFGPKPGAPDLNLLIAPAFAWVYVMTGDTVYRDRGDQIFAGGVRGAWLEGGKQFNQNYMLSFEYVALRSMR